MIAADDSSLSSDAPQRGLPPVVPPSGKFLAQLFLVPLLILLAAMLPLIGFLLLFGSGTSPEKYLERLDSSNADVRWRAASDLAQVLLRDHDLAGDPAFALALVERLQRTQRSVAAAEALLHKTNPTSPDTPANPEPPPGEADRSLLIYLVASVGNLAIPVGLPLLNELALDESGDAKFSARRRARALWALATLGDNLKRFDKFSAARQERLLAHLQAEASGEDPHRARWAETAANILKARRAGTGSAPGIVAVTARAAADENPFLRELAALVLSVWEGTPAENAVMDATLVQLTRDNGRGEALLDALFDSEDRQAQATVGRFAGRNIRYLAGVALARRGSDQVRLDLLEEMLDEDELVRCFQVRLNDGRTVPDGTLVFGTIENALKALVRLRERRPQLDLSSLRPAVQKLTENRNPALRATAERTLIALGND